MDIVGDRRLKLWRSKISPTNVELLQHVRSLNYQIAGADGSRHRFDYLIRDYSPAFRRLRKLTLVAGCLASFNQIGTPAAFQHTLSYVGLRCCSVTTSALVNLVNYFPNLAHLYLNEVSHEVDDQPIPPFSRLLQKLSIREFDSSGLGLIEQLMALRPQCDDVGVSLYLSSCPSLVHRVIDGVGVSVKRLSLEWWPTGVSDFPKSLSKGG